MSFDIDAELQKTFEEAVRPYAPIDPMAANALRTPQDWQRLQEIKEAAHTRIEAANRQYEAQYASRVAATRKRLIDEAGMPTHDVAVPVGRDRFNKDAINREAHKAVRGDHEALIAHIHDDERADIDALQDAALRRDQNLGKARERFNTVTDRRTGLDRRAPVCSR